MRDSYIFVSWLSRFLIFPFFIFSTIFGYAVGQKFELYAFLNEIMNVDIMLMIIGIVAFPIPGLVFVEILLAIWGKIIKFRSKADERETTKSLFVFYLLAFLFFTVGWCFGYFGPVFEIFNFLKVGYWHTFSFLSVFSGLFLGFLIKLKKLKST